MPRKHLIANLAIGNHFLIPIDIENKVIISDIYYDLLCNDFNCYFKEEKLFIMRASTSSKRI